jgi:hypothetical protein
MANVDEVGQSQSANRNGETERLAALVQASYEHARAAREFVDVDIDTLNAVSAGPVETIY